jgi:hypothetical protein
MANQYLSVLPSYDFFGKSIPGIFLVFGTVPLWERIPEIPNLDSVSGLNIPLLLALVLVVVFIGFIIGQVIHALSVNVEKVLYWAGHITHNFYYEHIADRILPFFSDDRRIGGGLNRLGLKRCWAIMRPWSLRRYWGLQDVFKSHRRLFENSLGWHFDKETSKRNSDDENLIYHGFRTAFDNNFTIGPYEDLAEFGIDSPKYAEFRQLYPLVASEVSRQDGGRATEFYARYSFCRGMWVTLLMLIFAYSTALLVDVPFIEYIPFLLQIHSSYRIVIFVGTIIGALVFLEASGEYKRHYVDYLITEFFAEYGTKGQSEQ